METKDAKRLKLGDRLEWKSERTLVGLVKEVTDCAIYVTWNDGQAGYVDFRDCEDIVRSEAAVKGVK